MAHAHSPPTARYATAERKAQVYTLSDIANLPCSDLRFITRDSTGEVERRHSSSKAKHREKIRKAGLISKRHKTMTTSGPVPRPKLLS